MTATTKGPIMADDTAALVARARAALEGTTPGPWSVFNYGRGKILSVSIGENANGQRPCVIDSGGFDGTDLPAKTNVANARLIASAPTLIADMADAITAQAAENANLAHDMARLKDSETHHLNRAEKAEAALAAALARVAVLEGIAARVVSVGDNGSQQNLVGDIVFRHGDGYAILRNLFEDARAALKGGAA